MTYGSRFQLPPRLSNCPVGPTGMPAKLNVNLLSHRSANPGEKMPAYVAFIRVLFSEPINAREFGISWSRENWALRMRGIP